MGTADLKNKNSRPGTFVADRRGSVAILFGLTVLILCGMAAFSVDFARALAAKSRLQSAVDAAVLAADPLGSGSLADVTTNVNANFTYNMPGQFGAISIAVATPVAIPNGYRVTAVANVPTMFGRLLGVTTIPISATAEAVRAKSNIELVLVLDNTASMDGAKLDALKASATKLVNDITAASTPGTVKFALVPFSNYVNVGLQYRSAPWMQVQNDWVEPYSYCWQTTDWNGCPTETVTNTCYNDGTPYSCNYQRCTVPGPPRQQCASGQNVHDWHGCAGSRLSAPDLTVSASVGGPIPGVLDVQCPSALTRLTTDDSQIRTQITAMIAQGETYIPSGLMWGWRVLAPDSPFADGASYSSAAATKKIMVLMTDGENTKSQNGNNHEGSDQAAADAATAQLCAKIKSNQIELYTIAYQVTAAQPKALLQACASPGHYYFDAQDSVALDNAFGKIAGSLIRLALSK